MNAWADSPEQERFSEVSERLAHIEASYADAIRTKNPLAFTTSVTALAKILDPEGVVRDSDFQVIASTQDILSQIETAFRGKLAGELDAEDTAIMNNILSQARILASSSAEGNLESYNRFKDTYRRGVVERQPEGNRIWEEKDFPGKNPQDLIDAVNQRIGSGQTSGPPADSGATPTGRVDSAGNDIYRMPDGREMIWGE